MTAKWRKVSPSLIAECSPRHIQSVLEDVQADFQRISELDRWQAQRAKTLFESTLTEGRYRTNRGDLPGSAFNDRLYTLWTLQLIDECDYQSALNETRFRLQRYFERAAESRLREENRLAVRAMRSSRPEV